MLTGKPSKFLHQMIKIFSKLFRDPIAEAKRETEIIGESVEKLKEENRLLRLRLEQLNKELGK